MTQRHNEQHVPKNTDNLRCWCYTCEDMTDHAVSDGNIGRCQNDHTKRLTPSTNKADTFNSTGEAIHCSAHGEAANKAAETLRRHIAALDGFGNRGNR